MTGSRHRPVAADYTGEYAEEWIRMVQRIIDFSTIVAIPDSISLTVGRPLKQAMHGLEYTGV